MSRAQSPTLRPATLADVGTAVLIAWGLVIGQPNGGRSFSQLPDLVTDWGRDLVGLVVDEYDCLKPLEKPLVSYSPYPALTPTPLQWLAQAQPKKYYYQPSRA